MKEKKKETQWHLLHLSTIYAPLEYDRNYTETSGVYLVFGLTSHCDSVDNNFHIAQVDSDMG